MSLLSPPRRPLLMPAWSRNDLWRRAGAVPSLDLNFAAAKALGPLVTFTRASSGTYVDSAGVLQTAATDVPRFDHNPTTGESLGLLVEEQRTNLLVRSEEFDNANWVLSSVAVTANQIASPSGSTTADLITGSAGTANKYVYQQFAASASGVYTFSVFAKAGTESFIVVRAVDQTGANEVRQRFDLSSGTLNGLVAVGGTATSGLASIVAFGNGWYRCTVTATFAAFIQLQGNVWLNAYSSTSLTTNFYLWGAQLEAGPFATSYIPTTTAAATRSADVASITGAAFSSWYRQDEGTVFVESRVQDFTVTNFSRIAALDRGDASANFAAIVRSSALNRVEYSVFAGTGQAVALQPAITFAGGSTLRSAFVYKTDDFIAAANGTLSPADTSGTMPTAVTTLGVGMQGNSGLPYNGTIRRLTYWPQRLANSTLQAITL